MTALDGPLTDWSVMDLPRKSRFVLPVPEYTPSSTSTVSRLEAAFSPSWMWAKGCAGVPLVSGSFVLVALTYQFVAESSLRLLKNTLQSVPAPTQALKFHTLTWAMGNPPCS